MRIGELARAAGVNPRTVRYYERIGLLRPAGRTEAGYRLYTAREGQRLAFIRRAQGTGLTLAEIAAILAIRDAGAAPCQQVCALAKAKVADVDRRIAELRALREELTQLASRAREVESACAAGAEVCLAFETDLSVAS